MECANLFMLHGHLPLAKAWLRLYWLYQDCCDEEMTQYSLKEAKTAYLEVFENTDIPESQIQQLQLTLGELAYRLKDYDIAKRFLLPVKTARGGSSALANHADDRLADIKKEQQG
jgi:hypothetical protein